MHITSTTVKYSYTGHSRIASSSCRAKSWELNYPALSFMLKVAVNRELQKFMHGLFILVLYIEVYTVILAILYCRASLVLLSQQIS